jgi:hypothetical protein
MAAFPIHGPRVATSDDLVLRAAVAAYLGRYRGQTRVHTESDLRIFLRWCTDHDLNPLAAVRVDIERYVRWQFDRGLQHHDADAVRDLGTALLASLSRHRQHGSDLIYEAYAVGIGGET